MDISVVEETGSTQSDLIAAVQRSADQWPHLAGLRAKVQHAGRGRTGREWDTSGLRALTVSYVLRPSAPVNQWGTIALRAGVAIVRALATHGVEARLKWPNDVVIETDSDEAGWHGIAKVGGVLGSVVRDSAGAYVCVLGVGLNLSGSIDVPGAASLEIPLAADLLARSIQHALAEHVPGDGDFAPLGRLVAPYCHTLGQPVVVTFPYETPPREIRGDALEIADDGALLVATNGQVERILSGDLAHTRLRPRQNCDHDPI